MRYHTLLALRCAHLACAFEEGGRPWAIVGGDAAPPEPSPFSLPEIESVVGTRKVHYLFLQELGGKPARWSGSCSVE